MADCACDACCVRSDTQRPNVLLIAVDPFRVRIQGGSLPDGKVTVIEPARRNCASNDCMAFESSAHSTVCPLPTPCRFHGVSRPICSTSGICVPAGIFHVGFFAWNVVSVPPMVKRIEKLRLSIGLVMPTPHTGLPSSPGPLNASQLPA